jgi:predicted XRE-type DNA-binding protein
MHFMPLKRKRRKQKNKTFKSREQIMDKCKKADKGFEPMIEKSSGNVFVDLGYSEDEAVNIVMRLELMMQIENIIKVHGWTQQQAAKVLGLTQSRVSELMSSRSEKFTIDKLMKLLDRLGQKIEFKVKPKKQVA